ncbi:MAG: pyridoxamine 5'-phosphate oxidase family protein [Pseudolysinimonas sp.]|uniref:pyridoxamine 5'-phosphate oxidase family protein n=1 Tax=Pseudolysinimonas sp. TaxID=2680009 RepID=UPI0032654BB7
MSEGRRGLRGRVREALDSSADLDPADIRVDATGGVIVLHGSVRTHAERLAAHAISVTLDGVEVVDNRLSVKAGTRGAELGDDEVATAVRAALVATGISLTEVVSTSVQHVVTLRGRVATTAARRSLHHAAAEVSGVDFVIDNLEVDADRAEVARGGDALDDTEIWRLLSRQEVGRLAMRRDTGVDIFPVNYLVGRNALYFRSGPGAKLELLTAHPEVAFETDGGRGATRWSVVIRGRVQRLDSDVEIESSGVTRIATWDPSEKLNYLRLDPDTISGRRFTHPR